MMLRKRVCCLGIACCLAGIVLSGCGKQAQEESAAGQLQQSLSYKEGERSAIPDEGIINASDMLEVSHLDRNREGNTAMYVPEWGSDEEGDYFQITEYTLDKDGNWERKDICEKSLTKRVIKKRSEWLYSVPYVCRGDDGELYVLLQMDWGEQESDGQDEDKTVPAQFSVLRLDEEQDSLDEISLRLDDSSLQGLDLSGDTWNKFHVLEDGTLFLVFGRRIAVQFDADSGAPIAVSENVPDNAFSKNVCYGEKEFIYYSTTSKLLSVLDLETLTISNTFGGEIDEDVRKKEWYFDTNTENGDMYAFNSSGLYMMKQSGKNTQAEKISKEGAFEDLAEATIFDVQIDAEKNVYVLFRKKDQENAFDDTWDFGVMKYLCEG
jgi:hypothetical protein